MAVFAAGVAAISLAAAWVVGFWIELPWWKIFRRCASIAAALMLWLMMRYVHRRALRSLGLGPWPAGARAVAVGMGLGCAVVGLIAASYGFSQVIRVSIHPDTVKTLRTLVGFIPVAGLVAVLEELVFRGYVLQQLSVCSKWIGMIGSSAAYALVHLKPGQAWLAASFELTGLFILGWLLARCTVHTNQLYLAIGLHASLAYWARVNKLVVAFTDAAPMWLVGTSRLVNGVVAWAALVALAWMINRWWLRGGEQEGGKLA